MFKPPGHYWPSNTMYNWLISSLYVHFLNQFNHNKALITEHQNLAHETIFLTHLLIGSIYAWILILTNRKVVLGVNDFVLGFTIIISITILRPANILSYSVPMFVFHFPVLSTIYWLQSLINLKVRSMKLTVHQIFSIADSSLENPQNINSFRYWLTILKSEISPFC